MLAFLSSRRVQSLLRTHPNDNKFEVVDPGHTWNNVDWLRLVEYYNQKTWSSQQNWSDLPSDLTDFIDQIRSFELDRTPIQIQLPPREIPLNPLPGYGLSPKKQHEVERMTDYIESLLLEYQLPLTTLRIVDVGAGQGYLTRSLAHRLGTKHILALDSDEAQALSAQKWEKRVLPFTSPITHKIVYITPDSLIEAVSEWVTTTRSVNESKVIPVFFVALHACGSLTPAILRAFLSASSLSSADSFWKASGLVTVGCCYNLLHPGDLPMSPVPDISIPPAAPALAAQVPSIWLGNLPSARLSVKKVVWRAFLSQEMGRQGHHDTVPELWRDKSTRHGPLSEDPLQSGDRKKVIGVGTTPTMRRLGKLNDALYTNWGGFLKVARERLGVDFTGIPAPSLEVQNRLSTLHTLRCLLGPLIETFIVEDRMKFLKEGLRNSQLQDVRVVNLFDQSTGSGRNMALVVTPMGELKPGRYLGS